MPKEENLSGSCTPDRCSFSSLTPFLGINPSTLAETNFCFCFVKQNGMWSYWKFSFVSDVNWCLGLGNCQHDYILVNLQKNNGEINLKLNLWMRGEIFEGIPFMNFYHNQIAPFSIMGGRLKVPLWSTSPPFPLLFLPPPTLLQCNIKLFKEGPGAPHLSATFSEIHFLFLSNWKEYDCSDNFPLDYEPNEILLGS